MDGVCEGRREASLHHSDCGCGREEAARVIVMATVLPTIIPMRWLHCRSPVMRTSARPSADRPALPR